MSKYSSKLKKMIILIAIHVILILTFGRETACRTSIVAFSINNYSNTTSPAYTGIHVGFNCVIASTNETFEIRLKNEHGNILAQDTNSTQLVYKLQQENCLDGGNYTCEVYEKDILVDSRNGYLQAVKCNSWIDMFTVNQSSNKTVITPKNNSISLSCNINHASKNTEIRIRDESGANLARVSNSKHLKFEHPKADCLKSGNYTCEVWQSDTMVDIANVYVLVFKCPPIPCYSVDSPKLLHGELGSNITIFICVITHPDVFKYLHQMSMNGKKITDDRSNRVSYSVDKDPLSGIHYFVRVFISKITPEDAGVITITGETELFPIVPFTLKLNVTGYLPHEAVTHYYVMAGVLPVVAIVFVVVALIIYRRKKLKAAQKFRVRFENAQRAENVYIEHRNDEEEYNTLDDAVDAMVTNNNIRGHDHDANEPKQCRLDTLPPLPPRPPDQQYIDFRLVAIDKNNDQKKEDLVEPDPKSHAEKHAEIQDESDVKKNLGESLCTVPTEAAYQNLQNAENQSMCNSKNVDDNTMTASSEKTVEAMVHSVPRDKNTDNIENVYDAAVAKDDTEENHQYMSMNRLQEENIKLDSEYVSPDSNPIYSEFPSANKTADYYQWEEIIISPDRGGAGCVGAHAHHNHKPDVAEDNSGGYLIPDNVVTSPTLYHNVTHDTVNENTANQIQPYLTETLSAEDEENNYFIPLPDLS
ncbi:uncharacterized protein LOC131927390 [Physella acuta]|uniref:uncharacterized protein LOC131927390 n=1 Tax=Physella acuta TaxID=109671 RepID=UPI0027DE4C78|nr:uncharacterized protein LOC131927390 [Physella acuta]